MGYSPWGRKVSDTPEWLHFHSLTAWRSQNCQSACLAGSQKNKEWVFGIFVTQSRKPRSVTSPYATEWNSHKNAPRFKRQVHRLCLLIGEQQGTRRTSRSTAIFRKYNHRVYGAQPHPSPVLSWEPCRWQSPLKNLGVVDGEERHGQWYGKATISS